MSYKSLIAYQKAFTTAMKIFKLTKKFPKEEMFGLTDQMRRSSRAVCSNMAEGYRKRKCEAHFISKLTDADMENSETQVWLNFFLHAVTSAMRNTVSYMQIPKKW